MASSKSALGGKVGLTFTGAFADSGTGNSFSINNRNVLIAVVGTGEVVVHGSIQSGDVDFSAASTIDNVHAVMELKDYSVISGYVLSGVVAGETKIFEVNTNFLSSIGIEIVAGAPEVMLVLTDNQ